ncbi:MAG: hypothetical protein WC867_03035 [Candidatus Pacearchaeota archaeon]|jgi:hypothetical protein
MSFNIIVPEVSDKPNSTKDMIITLLTYEWPLTLKQIYNRIKKQYTYSSTYQSVYKAVKELCEKKSLIEKDKKYEINIDWIKKLQSFTDIVETNYYAKEKIHSIAGLKESKSNQDITIINFETIFDAEKYLYYFMKTELFKTKNQEICYQVNHEWKPIFYLRAEHNYYLRLLEKGHKIYFVSSGNSYLEGLSKKFYDAIGVNFKIDEFNQVQDSIAFNDIFIQVFIPNELKKEMKLNLKNKDVLKLLKTLNTSSSIKMIINKDSHLAEEFKKQIISKF